MYSRITKTVVALATTGLTLGTAVALGPAADAAPVKPTKIDTTFLRSNEQVNLAEITLGTIVLNRSTGPHAIALARQTISDHQKAMKKNEAVARAAGITLPTRPNAEQRADAATLRGARNKAHEYFVEQVAGHRQSIAQTKTEIADGSARAIVSYAKYYLPVAQMHLRMSLRDLHRRPTS